MPWWVFLAPWAMLVLGVQAMVQGGWVTWALPAYTFIAIPVLDQLFPGDGYNPTPDEEQQRKHSRAFDLLIWCIVPVQFGLLALYLYQVGHGGFVAWELAGMTVSMGISCGVYGINVGHELGHRPTRFEQHLARAALLTSLYQHFFIEHNRGHHRRVATEEDPATARIGESVYAFWWRSIKGSWLSAWQLERERLERAGRPWLSIHNQMLRMQLGQAAFVVAIGLIFGALPLAGFLVAALIGALLLETINYIEHYGLSRSRRPDGHYERVQPVHSWNADRTFGRVFLYELTRHADHHAHAARPYQLLRHFPEAPQLPAGYPAMILLALIPPLFRAVMHPRIQQVQAA